MKLFQKNPSELDAPIHAVLNAMEDYGPESEEFEALTGKLERLERLKHETCGFRVSPDTLAVVAGNLLGILTIVAYEQKHVMVSKALGMVLRSKQTNP